MSKNRFFQILVSVIRLGLFVTLVGGTVLFIHAPIALTQDEFAGGAGTESDPYLIATAVHLDNVRDYPGAHFRLIADINLGVAPYGEGEGWVPIGTTGTPFTGSFDGDIYVIFNLTIDRSADYQGLFGYLSGATVENVYLENVSVQGGQYTGGLAGRANNSTIKHVHVTGELNGVQDTAGLVGYLGGGSNVAHASSEVVVQGGECTSGLVGYVDNASDTIYHAYTLGTVDGGLYTGGLVGRLYRGTVSDSYSQAAVSGSDTVGGAVGYVDLSTSYVYRTYSTGVVTGTSNVGGLVGSSSGTVTDSYWDTEISGQANSAGGTGKTTAEMQQQATFANYNFYTLWRIDEGHDYPIFQDLSAYPQPQEVDLADLTGDGTPGSPYLITSADELNAMRQALTATFQLANDIDLAATVTWDAGRGWTPLGDTTTPFTGALDGDGHTLYNLTVNRPTASYQGLFGYLDGATVQNVSLENVSVQGSTYTGGLAGKAVDSSLRDVAVSGEVTGRSNYTGGVLGHLDGGSLTGATSGVSVRGADNTGGVVGQMNNGGSVGHAAGTVRVEGGNYTGGVVGQMNNGALLYESYSLGTVAGNGYVGGLTGRHYSGYPVIVDSYSRAAVNGSSHVGGAVGHIYNADVYRTYSTGVVTGTSNVGGLVGYESSGGTVADSYWDTETSGQATSDGGTGKTTAAMQQQATYAHYNFYAVWQIDEGNATPIFQDLSGYAAPQAVDLADLDGDGTPGTPYLITSADELNAMRQALTATFQLANDIDLAATVAWDAGRGWLPIGDSTTPFTGTLDGDGHTLFNLTVNRPATQYQGLFGYLNGATVENLRLENVRVYGAAFVGGLAGRAVDSSLRDVAVSGEVTGRSNYTGGVLGHLDGGSLTGATSSVSVRGADNTGGVVGQMNNGGRVGHAAGTVRVEGRNYTGGVVGQMNNGALLYESYSLGTVVGNGYVGGLTGRHYSGYPVIVDSYSRAAVNGSSHVGGAVGHIYNADIYRTYSTGVVTGTSNVGGLVGYESSGGTVADSYWDTETSGQATSDGGTGKTTAAMQQQATYAHYNFYAVWQIDEGNATPIFQDLSGYATPQAVDLADLDGDGTPGTPYLITSADELNAMRQALTATFQLANDIDLAATVAWDAGRGWLPIGDSTTPFTGALDGDGHTLYNLTVNRPTASYQGLFGYLDGATVENLRLENVRVYGASYVGGLAGKAEDGSLVDVAVSGEVTGRSNYTGGVLGHLDGGSLTGATSGVSVRGADNTGGVVGQMNNGGSVGHAAGTVRVEGRNYTGGVVGQMNNGALLYESYSLGTVVGNGYVGGLTGRHYSGYPVIVDSYSRAAVAGSDRVGGAVGHIYNADVYRTYSTGVVTGTSNVGGLVGYESSGGTVADSYWDIETSGQTTSDGGTGKTTAEMQQQATFTNWDFDNVWAIVEDTTYPYQRQTATNLALFPTYDTYPSSVTATSTITVVSNVTWTATTNATWITLTGGTSGTGSGVISYTIAANPDPALRDGDITISSESAGITRTFRVRQGGTPLPFLTIFPGSRNHNTVASSGHAIDITSNITWTAQAAADWITLTSAAQGTDDGTLIYRLDDNPALEPRTSAIEISGGGITHTFTVTQAGTLPYLGLTPEHHHLDWIASAGHEIAVGANVTWTATTATDWITVTGGSSGTGDGVITYSVAANLTPAPRLGHITLTDGAKTWPFRVHQALSWHVALFANDGGSGTVNGSGTYTHGQAITVTATPAFGHHFVNWAEDGITVSTTSEYAFDVTRNRTLTATFDINIYTLTYTAGANGSVDGTDVITQYVAHGSDADPVTAIPNVGYYFLAWSDGVTDNPRTDTHLMDDLAVEAVFALGEAPVITSADHATFGLGVVGTFTVTTTGIPTPTLAYSGTLPGGITFTDHGNGTATLSGTPPVEAAGIYRLTFTASNTIPPDASQPFTLTVQKAPAITSADSVTFTVGAGGMFTVIATGVPTPSLSYSGTLPDSISFIDHGDGTATLSGTPTAGTGGVYNLTFTASNGVAPDASQPFTLMVHEAPAITSTDSVTFTVGAEGTFTVIATGVPTPILSYSGTLPGGISFTDHGDGTATLSGTPTAGTGGVYALTITASNGVAPDASQPFTLTVHEAPAITSADHATFGLGVAGTFTVTTTGVPTPAIDLSGDLPSGITFTDHGDGTATLSGTPAAGTAGVYVLTLTATNGVSPAADQVFTLTVTRAPIITSGDSTTFVTGAAGAFTVTATGLPTPTLTYSGTLPDSISFTDHGDGTATLSGTPTAGTAGVYVLTFTASNGVLPDAIQPFTLTVEARVYIPLVMRQ